MKSDWLVYAYTFMSYLLMGLVTVSHKLLELGWQSKIRVSLGIKKRLINVSLIGGLGITLLGEYCFGLAYISQRSHYWGYM